jgi:release factor glutamine methyltransferase
MILSEAVIYVEGLLLKAGIENARSEAELLISYSIGIERFRFITDKEKILTLHETEIIIRNAERRAKREPLAYITGVRGFYGLDFYVSPAVLIPRPDTELLVECASAHARQNARMLDICTGSGAVAVALKHIRPDCIVSASDISEDAVIVAKKNADALVGGNIRIVVSNLFEAFSGEQFDVITVNPPYIDALLKGSLQKEIDCEPDIALYSSEKGMTVIEQILSTVKTYLADDGVLYMEIGYDQGNAVIEMCTRYSLSCRILKDYSGNDRVAEILLSTVS